MSVIEEIADERARQIGEEDWQPEHDAEHHSDESLALVAALYASPIELFKIESGPRYMHAIDPWPWKREQVYHRYGEDFDPVIKVNDGDKRNKHDRRKRLVIAAALIVAEIERFDRAIAAAEAEG